MSKISIIVPVYKAEQYIRRCLDSIVTQTFTDWECLLIDDGSPDNSGKICDEYAEKDGRFRVFHKENGGVSSARQLGLDNSFGDYIIHCDPDDWVEPSMINDLYFKAIEDDADMIICDFWIEKDCSIYSLQKPSSLNHFVVLREMFSNLIGTCWNKLVKREIITKYNPKFPTDINYCEDLCFNSQLLKHDIVVGYLGKALYHYVQNPNSIVSTFTLKRIEENKQVVLFLENILRDIDQEFYLYILNNYKLSTKFGVFEHPILSRNEYLNLYREVNTLSCLSYGKVRGFLFSLSLHGFYYSSTFLYKLLVNIRSFLSSFKHKLNA